MNARERYDKVVPAVVDPVLESRGFIDMKVLQVRLTEAMRTPGVISSMASCGCAGVSPCSCFEDTALYVT
ncbi:MAG: hypothetical protein ACLR7U_13250 [Ruthenibacterium lactatiformans]